MDAITEIFSDEFYVWIGEDDRRDLHEYVVIGFKKVKGGVKHLVYRYKDLNIEKIKTDIAEYGNFSKRPYSLAQACDGSIDCAVAALYYSFCKAKNINAAELYKKAYPDGEPPDYKEVCKYADWEGVEYPEKWDKGAYEGLIESLTEVNNHSLVGELCELEKILNF
ncbi:MAG: hypothetical protein ACYCSB_01275 [bacterium]|jgi:hypothetical protein